MTFPHTLENGTPCVEKLADEHPALTVFRQRLFGEVTLSNPAGHLELVAVMLTLATRIQAPSPHATPFRAQ